MSGHDIGPVYMGEWAKTGFIGMVADFSDVYMTPEEFNASECPIPNLAYWLEKKARLADALASENFTGVNVLVADYDTPPYEGDAFVLFERNGKLFEVSAGHCSCYGLEGQWEPEETSADALWHRLENATYGRFHDNAEFRAAIAKAAKAAGATP